MIHPDVEVRRINEFIGYGVFAIKKIPKGTLTYIKDPLEIKISENEFSEYTKIYQNLIEKYSYRDRLGTRVISWDLGNFVNHSCDPNTISTAYGFEIALRDIEVGEELTDDYGLFNMSQEMLLSCSCTNCRLKVTPNDIDLYANEWDNKIISALNEFRMVNQPLLPYLDEQSNNQINSYLDNIIPYTSVNQLKYNSHLSYTNQHLLLNKEEA